MSVTAAALTARVLVAEAVARLEAAGLPTARPDAEWLLGAVLGRERFATYLEPERALTPREAEGFRALVARRAGHEPLQHLLGFEDFHGLRLLVTPDALIPRPETEGLVAWALDLLDRMSAEWGRAGAISGPPLMAERQLTHLVGGNGMAGAISRPPLMVADIGTGSGAIACALAHARPHVRVLATDRSAAALAVAAENVRALGLGCRVELRAGDLLEPLGDAAARLDLIVANLPYLPTAVLPTLPREVREFEPRAALDGGPDGLRALRRLVKAAAGVLRGGGWIVLEIGEEQAGPLASLMGAEGFTDIAARRDLRGVERYVAGRLGGGAGA
ncbi:MAG TPA: HemK/PrmC family methyltransferase [Methylomirabilota bacterium]|nr:HemK/PrmC family methyltransferase [Methylomirabilota bacterium]